MAVLWIVVWLYTDRNLRMFRRSILPPSSERSLEFLVPLDRYCIRDGQSGTLKSGQLDNGSIVQVPGVSRQVNSLPSTNRNAETLQRVVSYL